MAWLVLADCGHHCVHPLASIGRIGTARLSSYASTLAWKPGVSQKQIPRPLQCWRMVPHVENELLSPSGTLDSDAVPLA
jgi:hypothetical protein